jgi:hypothetical protein
MNWRAAVALVTCVLPWPVADSGRPGPVVVTIIGSRSIHTFRPDQAWGAALDGHEYSRTASGYTPANIAAMRSTALGPISYRLRSELAIETWHWNPAGSWSDPARQQGYWTSSASAPAPILMSFGYRLPRRGRTLDDANNDGYSRVDDGDTTSFWKTNPYLDPRFTPGGERDHAQWLVVDLGTAQLLDAARIAWGDPFPTHYVIDYWVGDQTLPIDRNPDGQWVTFTKGTVTNGQGGDVMLSLESHPVRSRFVRLTLSGSSHTAAGGNGDPRDSLGFALRELWLGTLGPAGEFHDAMRHATSATGQSEILVSSTDPWHRASDLDSNVAQPGLDLLFRSGLTRGQPALVPTGLLFDTPENAAAELRFLRWRGYPVRRVELGEEPDGQRVTPEDHAALYLQFARALRQVDATITLGGPSMQTLYNDELRLWPARTSPGRRSTWIGRFVDYLDARNRLADFRFFSFEWYPFDDVCGPPAPHLAEAPARLSGAIDRLRAAGLPAGIPFVMTEYGYSAHASPVEIDLAGAIFNAETVANFSAHQGAAAYAFGMEPAELMHEPDCPQWGNLAFFLADSAGQVRDTLPGYWAARLLTTAWADSAGGNHHQYATVVSTDGSDSSPSVGAYALRRPDGRWSVLLLNRDPATARSVAVLLQVGEAASRRPLKGPIDLWQYSSTQYQFHADGEAGRPSRNLPPAHRVMSEAATPISLPPMSITVITGR